jgi:hypothetical protein
MIKTHSDDPDVAAAAADALNIVTEVLNGLPKAESFDYGGHQLKLGEYDVCTDCSTSIAEAQAAANALHERAEGIDDPVIKEHLELAAHLLHLEAEAAVVRAEFHNGHGTEPILNVLLGFAYDRKIHDDYSHNHEAEQ